MEGCQKIKILMVFMTRILDFIRKGLTELQRFMHFGLQRITERPTIFLLVMEFYLIMNLLGVERHL